MTVQQFRKIWSEKAGLRDGGRSWQRVVLRCANGRRRSAWFRGFGIAMRRASLLLFADEPEGAQEWWYRIELHHEPTGGAMLLLEGTPDDHGIRWKLAVLHPELILNSGLEVLDFVADEAFASEAGEVDQVHAKWLHFALLERKKHLEQPEHVSPMLSAWGTAGFPITGPAL